MKSFISFNEKSGASSFLFFWSYYFSIFFSILLSYIYLTSIFSFIILGFSIWNFFYINGDFIGLGNSSTVSFLSLVYLYLILESIWWTNSFLDYSVWSFWILCPSDSSYLSNWSEFSAVSNIWSSAFLSLLLKDWSSSLNSFMYCFNSFSELSIMSS